MRDIFEAELGHLGDGLVDLARRVRTAIVEADAALITPNVEQAQQVIDGDGEVDALAREADDRAVLLLAQQAPVATDLRVVVSAIRMAATLERMGDLAQHVAFIARHAYPASALPETVVAPFTAMTAAADRLAGQLVTLLSDHDLALADEIERDDDTLDGLHQQITTIITAPDWDGTPQQTVDVALVARFLERLGDHGVSVARRIRYLVTGSPDLSA